MELFPNRVSRWEHGSVGLKDGGQAQKGAGIAVAAAERGLRA